MSAVSPEVNLKPGGRLRRRRIVNRIMESIGTLAALIAVAVLVIVVVSVVRKGAPSLSWHFLTAKPNLFGGPGGGISNAIVGTGIIVGLAPAIALPVGVLIAIYLTEFASKRVAAPIQLVVDVMAGLPTIVVGVFVYGLLVVGHTQSGYAGSIALSI